MIRAEWRGKTLTDAKPAPKRPRGRPPRQMPEPIPDTPENIMQALLATPPKKDSEWDYTKKAAK